MTQQDLMFFLIFGLSLVVIYSLFVAFGGGGTRRQVLDRVDKLGKPTESRKAQRQIAETLKKKDTESSIGFIDRLIKALPNLNKLRYRLEMADTGLSAGKYLLGNLVLMVIIWGGLEVGTKFYTSVAVCFGIALGLWLPHAYLNFRIRKKMNRFVGLFPDAIELIVRGLRSGLPVQESFKVISEEIAAPVGKEFGFIAQAIKLGVPLDKALVDESKKLKILEFDFFVTSLNLQRETGGNLAEILSNLSSTIRERHMMKMKIKAMSSEARASAWIVGALPFLVIIALKFINPEYLEPLFEDTRGNIAGMIGLSSLGMGIFVMKKMASFEI